MPTTPATPLRSGTANQADRPDQYGEVFEYFGQRPFVSKQEAADFLGIHVNTFPATGIPFFRVSKRRVSVRVADIAEHLAGRKNAPLPPSTPAAAVMSAPTPPTPDLAAAG
jgi:hypothetical protein